MISLTKFAVIAYAVIFYMLVLGIHDWRLWIPIVFIAVERIFLQLAYVYTIQQMVIIGAAYQIMKDKLNG
jgi:hypothetical protein